MSDNGIIDDLDLLSAEEKSTLLARAEALWTDLQRNELGGFSNQNRPFLILSVFRSVIEDFGRRNTGYRHTGREIDNHLAAQRAGATASPVDARIESAVRKLRLIKHDFGMRGANATTIERAIHLIKTISRGNPSAIETRLRDALLTAAQGFDMIRNGGIAKINDADTETLAKQCRRVALSAEGK